MPFDRDLRDLLRATKAFARSPAEDIRRELGGDLETAERRVREAEALLDRQQRVIEWRRARGFDTELAETLLQTYLEVLATQRRHLLSLRKFPAK